MFSAVNQQKLLIIRTQSDIEMNVALVFWLANVMSQVLDSTLSPSDAVFGSSAAHAHASLKAPGTAGDFKEPMLRCSVFSHEPAEVVNQNKIRHARIYHEYIIYRTLFRSDIVAWQVFVLVLPLTAHHMRRFYCCPSKLCVCTAVLSSFVDSENVDV